MDSRQAQDAIAAAVEERGYRDGWTAQQFAARQIPKLCEELAELARHFYLDGWIGFAEQLERVGESAREAFDHTVGWSDACILPQPGQRATAEKELSDIQVVVFALAAALGEVGQTGFDVVEAAAEKADADIERGIG